MMRVYVSGPITGVDDYKENFIKAQASLIKQGYEVINPAGLDEKLPKLTYEEYMKLDILLLGMCDAIYMLEGWEKSCGANWEYGYALATDKVIMQE